MTATDLANLGETHHLNGELDEAEPLYREALAIYEAISDPAGTWVRISDCLAGSRWSEESRRRRLSSSLEGLRLSWESGDHGGAADLLDALAEAAVDLGRSQLGRQNRGVPSMSCGKNPGFGVSQHMNAAISAGARGGCASASCQPRSLDDAVRDAMSRTALLLQPVGHRRSPHSHATGSPVTPPSRVHLDAAGQAVCPCLATLLAADDAARF